MSPMTMGVVAVVVVLGVALYVWHANRETNVNYSWGSTSVPRPTYECDPETCVHEWVTERVEDVEMTIDYCSYGGPDPVGIVTYTHYYCPKCGAHEVEESEPVPL